MTHDEAGISGHMADLYDVFVDWPGRLAREMPGLMSVLEGIGAKSILDVGCGTGRHVAALVDRGYRAIGSDVSVDMLAAAQRGVGADGRFFRWCLGEGIPEELSAHAPFDAISCLGNVWPQVTAPPAITSAAHDLHSMLAPGGIFVAGMKAVAVRRDEVCPAMPILRREHEGSALYFVRFLDFARSEDVDLCDFHMVLVSENEAHRHQQVSTMRVWSPEGLQRCFLDAGFEEVSVSGRLGDPDAPVSGEDVFVHARRS